MDLHSVYIQYIYIYSYIWNNILWISCSMKYMDTAGYTVGAVIHMIYYDENINQQNHHTFSLKTNVSSDKA